MRTDESTTAADQTLATIVELLQAVLGEDFLLDVEISRQTSFSDDLALESIEFVALAEELQQHYAGRVDLVAFMAELEIDEIMAMTLGQLVDYIARVETAATTVSGG